MSFLGLSAIKRNNIKTLQRYMIGICILGFGPLIYGVVYYSSDVWEYLTIGKTSGMQLWKVNNIK